MEEKDILRKKTIINRILIVINIVLLLLGIILLNKYFDEKMEREIGESIKNAFSETETTWDKLEKELSVMDNMSFSENGSCLFISICYFNDGNLKMGELGNAIEKVKNEYWFNYDYVVVDIWNPQIGMVTSIETNLQTMDIRSYGWYQEELEDIEKSKLEIDEDLNNEEETLIYEDENIKVQYVDITGSDKQYKINFIIENLSDTTITVQFRETSINGFMVDPIGSIEIAPHKKAQDGMTMWGDEAEEYPKDSIESIEAKLHIFSDDNSISYETENIVIK